MMYYDPTERENEEALKRVKKYRDVAALVPVIAKIIRDFDNKVFNCRFSNSLNEATNREIYANKNEYWLEIYAINRGYHLTLAHVSSKELKDGKRIPAEKLLESLRQHRESLLQKAYSLENTIEQVPQIKAYIREVKDKMDAFLKNLPDDIRSIYHIPYCVRLD